jgi:hypothetical protein
MIKDIRYLVAEDTAMPQLQIRRLIETTIENGVGLILGPWENVKIEYEKKEDSHENL